MVLIILNPCMVNKKTFGERNKTLSDELLRGNTYFDWVITTAFYSAIHFVEDHILPQKINDTTCEHISEVKTVYKMEGRHAARERLVFSFTNPEVGARYKWLDDKSRNARYKTYKVQNTEAQKAKEYLTYIYKFCYP